ncbi:hypothetical protein AKJ16_DCAP08309 [Drosera capensis]
MASQISDLGWSSSTSGQISVNHGHFKQPGSSSAFVRFSVGSSAFGSSVSVASGGAPVYVTSSPLADFSSTSSNGASGSTDLMLEIYFDIFSIYFRIDFANFADSVYCLRLFCQIAMSSSSSSAFATASMAVTSDAATSWSLLSS